ncbi:MAG TPA: BTAD domain-containing putative transcriptional regulator [Ktedonobacterales bacterium]|nr:BTAD domain-containing putative transcriptional regulator [Ktedonobacterales bacterium]
MPTTLHIRLLGAFSLIYGDKPVAGVNTPRLQSLLAWLLTHNDAPQLRQRLAFLLWPNSSETQARNNLRQALHALRQALPDNGAFLYTDANVVQWRPDAPFTLDVAEFERALDRAEAAERLGDEAAMSATLEQALTLYQADLLPSCYDEWIAPERERLRQRCMQALDQLISLLEKQRDYPAAIKYAQRLIRHDPLNESAYCHLMRLLAMTGNRTGALRVYHACMSALRRELGVAPSQTTREVYEYVLHLEGAAAADGDDQRSGGRPAAPSRPASGPPLIGRQREWERLSEAWSAASASGPAFALITGEAGIGKSYLAEEFLRWTQQSGATIAKTRCYAAEGQLSLAPVTDWLRTDGLRQSLESLDRIWLTEVARILPELLSAHPDLPHYEPIGEYGQRRRFFEALARAVLAAPLPLLLLIDDVQWCDQETLEWLHFLLRFDSTARVLVMASARAEEMLPGSPTLTSFLRLRDTIGWTEIALESFDAAETAKLAARIAGHELDTPRIMRLFRETEGNPLFVVETMRAGMDARPAGSEAERPETLGAHVEPVPPRVRAVIASRLAGLSAPARALAAVAATIGREFSVDVLMEAARLDEDSAVQALDELWQKRIVREYDAYTYDFSHDKLREIAYADISAPQRRLLHRRIAETLERIHAEDLDVVSGQIASHYEGAGLAERAMPYYERAASIAQRIYANDDAIAIVNRTLSLLRTLPAGAKRDAQELSLLLSLSSLYRITKGWTAPELERALDRALTLCDIVGDDAQRAKVLFNFQSLLVVQAKLDRVQLVSEELEALHEHTERAIPAFSGLMLAGARFHLGRLREADAAFAAMTGQPQDDPAQQRLTEELQGWDLGIHARAWRAHVLHCLGFPAQALDLATEAVRVARELGAPFNLALAATYLAMLQQYRADPETAGVQTEEALAITREYRVPYYHAWSAILFHYTQTWRHPSDLGLDSLRRAIAELTASGARLRLPYYLSLQAQICARMGRLAEAMAAIDEAMAESRANNERWWDAELHRMRAELIVGLNADAGDVEQAFQRSLAIARAQSAKSLELRAAASFARFLRARDRGDEGRDLLQGVYGWFTEGFDMPDLLDARALLTDLS